MDFYSNNRIYKNAILCKIILNRVPIVAYRLISMKTSLEETKPIDLLNITHQADVVRLRSDTLNQPKLY